MPNFDSRKEPLSSDPFPSLCLQPPVPTHTHTHTQTSLDDLSDSPAAKRILDRL